ncbi:MAG TPA: DUF305 domain-containing protein [Gemmatimonadales bacterium]|nr:DUF305 domain-containing protein [Gemmatimonadales bacterium]
MTSGKSIRVLRVALGVAVVAVLSQQGARAQAPQERYPASKDDAEFMQGMIAHHAQAVVMAKEAPSHGASEALQVLCARIAASQHDDIIFMQNWLRDHKFAVPDTNGRMPAGSMSGMAGMAGMSGSDTGGVMMMPGMLTPAQMKMLDAARGAEWNRLFMTFMIQHHTGALSMVDTLFASPAGGQDDDIFKFATAVHADQTAEIARMEAMLEDRPIQGGPDR